MKSPETGPGEQVFDITSEEQLSDYRIVGLKEPDEQQGKAKAKSKMERARQLIREKGGLTESDRHVLGLHKEGEDSDTSF